MMLVTDIRLGPGLFYQIYTIFNLIYVHGVLRNHSKGTVFEWTIVSHRWLRFLHPLVSRRLTRLNKDQINEDVPIRIRRAELKKRGFSFGKDDSYLGCNENRNQTRFPSLSSRAEFAVDNLKNGILNSFTHDPIDLLILREGPQSFRVWTSVCPHEGGPLDRGRLCESGSEIICPWHGLKQKGHVLSPQSDTVEFQTFSCRLSGPDWKIELSPK
jgi:nitrite reductase/ring-hydroxylating ferredoxin subunit